MKLRSLSYLLLIVGAVLALGAPGLAQSLNIGKDTYLQREGDWYLQTASREFKVLSDTLTIKPAPGLPLTEYGALFDKLGLKEIRHNRLGFYDMKPPKGEHALMTVKRLLSHPAVAEAFPATVGAYVTNDPDFSSQWNMHNTGSGGGTPDADIDAPEAWALATGDPAIIVAPLDSGIDYHHNDLGPNVWQNLGEDADHDGSTLIYSGGQWIFDPDDINNIDDDGNGMKDDLVGWDPEHDNNDVMDIMGHGTHVSGIVAARSNNATGVAGVAGGWGAQAGVRIMMVQVGDWSPNSAILDDAILYAVDNGARVITMSLSVSQSSAIDSALNYAESHGVFVDCAAGNNYGGAVNYPATVSTVVAVSATTRTDSLASFSSKGPEVEIAAPGDDITSTLPGQSTGSMSGTSMAAPHIGGAAGLLLSVAPWMNGNDVKNILFTTADDKGTSGWDSSFGWGRLNLYQAVLAVADPPDFYANAQALSARFGGSIHFSLNAGTDNGGRTYLILGTVTGTSPGLPLPGGLTTLPINWDWFTDFLVARLNTTMFDNFLGALDVEGQASAQLNVGSIPLKHVGKVLNFAYTVDEPFDFVSTAVAIEIVN